MASPPAAAASSWQRTLGIATALLLFVAAVEWLVGWRSVAEAAARLSLAGALALLLGLAASYVLRGLRVYLYFHEELRGRFAATLRLTLVHNATANLLPMRAGELSFPYLAKRDFELEPIRTIAALVWFRLLDLLLLGGIALAVLATGIEAGGGRLWLPVLALPLVVLAASRARLKSLASHLPARLAGIVAKAADGLPSSHGAALRDLVVTAANWLIKLVALGAAFLTLVGDSPWQAGLAAAAGEVSGILPVAAPGGLGTYEAVVVAAAVPFGVAAAAALQAAVTLHLIILAASLAGFALAAWLPRR